MSAVTGRALVGPAPTLTPTERKSFGGSVARRFETVTFTLDKETLDVPFPFLSVGEGRSLRIKITGFRLVEPVAGEGFGGEEYGVKFTFTWPEGVTGVNPRNPLVIVKHTGGVTGAVFGLPLNECRPTTTDGEVLKIAYRKTEGGAKAAAVELFLEVIEEWTEVEVPTLVPTPGPHAVGVAQPEMKVIGCNGGAALMPPIEVGRSS